MISEIKANQPKWLVLLFICMAGIITILWVNHQHAESARRIMIAAINRQFSTVLQVLDLHKSQGRYPDLNTVRNLRNDPALLKALQQTSLFKTADWLYNPNRPAGEKDTDSFILGARNEAVVYGLKLDGSLHTLTSAQATQAGLVPLFPTETEPNTQH